MQMSRLLRSRHAIETQKLIKWPYSIQLRPTAVETCSIYAKRTTRIAHHAQTTQYTNIALIVVA
ncbi:hypothetical protein CANCADRAFT_107017 [Tortispora caseinolytica NRRL Y-17796]|uniref:Uncharacterized protein n=1 Tax=Tortispora caseinolytica NRRL Y-17796 TaxID=767744 RepID=A0A1E4TFK1_9ASCO|nr:hypothetical protein CANCADRAFT_107017 [Tortispora caseinolytica NRRL Y-17796]